MKDRFRLLYQLLIMLAIDIIIIGAWLFKEDPDESGSIVIIILIPYTILINMILALIFYFVKRKPFVRLFAINAVLASAVMYFLFGAAIDRHDRRTMDWWQFKQGDTTFYLIRYKETDRFSMSYRTDPGSSTGFMDGTYKTTGETLILKPDSGQHTLTLKHDTLIGFRKLTDTVKLAQ